MSGEWKYTYMQCISDRSGILHSDSLLVLNAMFCEAFPRPVGLAANTWTRVEGAKEREGEEKRGERREKKEEGRQERRGRRKKGEKCKGYHTRVHLQ